MGYLQKAVNASQILLFDGERERTATVWSRQFINSFKQEFQPTHTFCQNIPTWKLHKEKLSGLECQVREPWKC